MMLSQPERAFLLRQRIGHFATADGLGTPSVVPVCFALDKDILYTAVDDKPKRSRHPRRIRNLEANSRVAFVADRYDEDWSMLGWVMIRGAADLLASGEKFERGCDLLRRRYVQYARMHLSPLIAVRILEAGSWGNLDA